MHDKSHASPSAVTAGARAGAAPSDEFLRQLEAARLRICVAIRARIPAQLRSVIDADDVWQETTLAAMNSAASFQWQGDLAFLRWVMTIAKRTLTAISRHHLGRDLDRPHQVPIEDLAEIIYRTSTGPATAAQRKDDIERVLRAVRRLPPVQRDVLTLDLVHLMTYEEMAAALDKSKAAVMQAHLRAVQAVRADLAG